MFAPLTTAKSDPVTDCVAWDACSIVVPSLGFGFLPFSIAVLVISTTLAVELHTKHILLI